MDSKSAATDLAYIRDVLDRTERQVDPHAFHYVSWGAIVLVWYPLMSFFGARGDAASMVAVSVGSLILGIVLSIVFESRLQKNPRLPAENTFVGAQVGKITAGCVAGAIVLNIVAPMFQMFPEEHIPVIWGFAYAVMAFMVGVVYRREFTVAGICIFAAAVVAIRFPTINGDILGPAMGLGMIIPGMMAERRVRALQAELGSGAPAA